jgi:hypothetical protein
LLLEKEDNITSRLFQEKLKALKDQKASSAGAVESAR